MKKSNLNFLLVLVFTLTFFSCIRNNLDFAPDATINDIVVPADFDWSTLSTVDLTVISADKYQAKYYYVIEVFGENPVLNNSAPLLAKGVANSNRNFVTHLIIPSATKTIFVRQTDPLKKQIIQSVGISSASLTCDFNSISSSHSSEMPMISAVSKRSAGIDTDPTPAGATVLTSSSGDVTWKNNTNYLIRAGVTYTGQIQLGTNSSLYVEGNYNLSGKNKYFKMASGSKLIIQSGGSVSIASNKGQQYDNNAQIKNFGTLSYTSDFIMTGTTKLYNAGTMNFGNIQTTTSCEIKNYGILSSNKSVNLTTNATLYNVGTINFASFTTENINNTVTNEGSFTAQNFTVKSVPFTNTGSLTVINTLQLTSPGVLSNFGSIDTKYLTTESGNKIYNNCHIVVENATSVPGTSVYLYEGSLFKTLSLAGDGTNFEMDKGSILEAETTTFTSWGNYIKGVGTDYALARLATVKPVSNEDIASNITYQGKVEIEFTTHTQNIFDKIFFNVVGSDVRWAATGASTTVIASSDCNAGGNNESDPGDVPSDPTFPIVVPLTTNYSFIMEDNWPFLGDYDMNDLVVDLSISYLQNAENKAIEMKVSYKLRAVGANFRIAAAFQLDKILPSQISSVSYYNPVLTGGVFTTEKGGLEAGQSKAVIPLFDDAHSLLDPTSSESVSHMLNTVNGSTYYMPVSDTITIVFETPVDPSDISIANLNFFIVTNGSAASAQRKEIHLSGFEPTDKIDSSLFGTGDDASFGTAKYRTANNLIWGLLIPTSFNYAVELKDITAVYPQFAGWCSSGGVNNVYWYEFPTDKNDYIFIVK